MGAEMNKIFIPILEIFGLKKQENVKCFTGSLPLGKGSDEKTYARL